MSSPHPSCGFPSSLPRDYALLSQFRAANAIRSPDDGDHLAGLSELEDGMAEPSDYFEEQPLLGAASTSTASAHEHGGSSSINVPLYGATNGVNGAVRRTSFPQFGEGARRRRSDESTEQDTSETEPLLIPRISEACDELESNDWNAWWEELRILFFYSLPVLRCVSTVSPGRCARADRCALFTFL